MDSRSAQDIVLNLQEQAGEASCRAPPSLGAELPDLTGINVVVSRSFEQIPRFSSGKLFNAAKVVKIRNRRSKDGSFHICMGWILFPILLVPRGRV